ncbi:MAG: hypothetical protein SVY53_09975 [Chloroflexota bacterium]|nr:hypothetical protein [Chloroflexota bacterium]
MLYNQVVYVPYGRRKVFNTFRVYDAKKMNFILRENSVVEQEAFSRWNRY